MKARLLSWWSAMSTILVLGACADIESSAPEPELARQEASLRATGPVTGDFVLVGNGSRCMQAGTIATGSPVQLWDCQNVQNQRFKIVPVNNGEASLRLPVQGPDYAEFCVDITDSVFEPGTALQAKSCAWGAAQHFVVRSRGAGFELRSASRRHLCIGARANGTSNGTRLELQTCDSSAKQLFSLATAQAMNGPPVVPSLWSTGRTLNIEDRSLNEHGFRVYGRALRHDGSQTDFVELRSLGAQPGTGVRQTVAAPAPASGRPYEFKVTVYNGAGEASAGVIIDGPQDMLPTSSCVLNTPEAGKSTVWLEAELPQQVTGFDMGTDGSASGGRFLSTPEFALNDNFPSSAGRVEATYTFSVPTAGDYVLWARGKGDSLSSNTFFFQIDGRGSSADHPWWSLGVTVSPAWLWTQSNDTTPSVRTTLTAGTHTLTIARFEDGAKLDAIVLTSKSSVNVGSLVGCSSLTEELTPVLDSTLTCTAESITSEEPNPGCAGPWKYSRNPTCSLRDPSCGLRECVNRPACRHVQNGYDMKSKAYTGRLRVDVRCAGDNIECGPGTPDPQCPDPDDCWPIDEAAAVAACRAIGTDYDNHGNLEQTPTILQHLIRYDVALRPTLDVRHGYFDCLGTAHYPVVKLQYNEACRCAQEDFVSCPVSSAACGNDTAEYFSSAGLKRSEIVRDDAHFAAQKSALCMSCDDKPMDTAAQVREKFRCLSDQFDILTQQTPRGEDYRAPGHGDWTAEDLPLLAARMRVLYELRGDALNASQRATARAFYYSHPAATLACGADDDVGSGLRLAPGCAPNQGLLAELDRCDELTGNGVSSALAATELLGCVSALDAYAQLATPGSNCVFAEDLQTASDIVEDVMEKSLGVIESHPGTLGQRPRVLYKLNQWYEATSAAQAALGGAPREQPGPLQNDATAVERLNRIQNKLWKALQGSFDLFDNLADQEDMETALKVALERGLTMDRDVLAAAFRRIETLPALEIEGVLTEEAILVGGSPLRGMTLLTMLGDSLGALTRRMRDLTALHTLACQFSECTGRVTPLSSMWSLLAALDDAALLRTRVDAVPDSLDSVPGQGALEGWKSTFDVIQRNHSALSDALSAALNAPDHVAYSTANALIAEYLDAAKRTHSAYDRYGLLDPGTVRTMFAGQTATDRAQVLERRASDVDRLGDALDRHKADLATLVDSALEARLQADASSAISAEKARLDFEIRNVSTDIEGLRASSSADRKRLGDIGESLVGIAGSIDPNQYFRTGEATLEVKVSARDAVYDPRNVWQDLVTDWAVDRYKIEATAGEMVVINMRPGSEWSPSCALGLVRVKDPSMEGIHEIGSLEAFIGPEGYRLSRTQSGYDAYAFNDTYAHNWFLEVGVKAEICHKWEVGEPDNSVGGSECAYIQAGMRAEDGWNTNYSNGWENRTSASFAGGLRLTKDSVPFPAYPVGALLLVELPRHETRLDRMIDVHLVNPANTTVLVDQATDFYFVVNDRECPNANDTHKLAMDVFKLTSAGTITPHVIKAMRKALVDVRSHERDFVAQGRILPTQVASIRSAVELSLQTDLDLAGVDVDVDNMPGPLLSLFRAYLDKEIVELERATEISQLVREEKRLDIQRRQQDVKIEDLARQSRIAQLLPAWTLQNMDAEGVRHSAALAIEGFRKFVYPILELWYPTALSVIRRDRNGVQAKVTTLLNAPLSSKTLDLTEKAYQIMYDILGKYGDASPGFERGVSAKLVLSHPNPCAQNAGTSGRLKLSELPKSESSWLATGDSRARHVWSQVYGRGRATFQIAPGDVFRLEGGSPGFIDCSMNTPVITHMAVVVIKTTEGSGTEGSYEELNQGRWLRGSAKGEQPFVTARETINYTLGREALTEDGDVDYTLGEPQEFHIPLLYVPWNTPLSQFDRMMRERPLYYLGPVGLSPFSELEINFAAMDDFARSDIGDGLGDAVEIALVAVVEGRSAELIARLPSCDPDYEPASVLFDSESIERPDYCPAAQPPPCNGNCPTQDAGTPTTPEDAGVDTDAGVPEEDGGFGGFPDDVKPGPGGTKPGKGGVISEPLPTPPPPEAM